MNKSKDLFKVFTDIESEQDLFNLKVAGVYVWERIRTQVYFKIYEKLFNNTDNKIRRKSKLRMLLSLVRDIRKNPFFTRQKDVLFVGHPRRVLQNDGKWMDMYSDYVIEKLGLSTVLVEPFGIFEHRQPTRTKHVKYLDFIEGAGQIKRLLRMNKLVLTDDEEIYLSYLSVLFHERTKEYVDILSITRSVLTRRKQDMPMYDRLLNRIRPKVVVVICSYGKEDFIEACKDKSIPVVELQHGIISQYHPGYSFQGNIKRTFPDYLLTWGDYWSTCTDFPIPYDSVISVGFPHSEKFIFEVHEKTNTILFISQPRLGTQLAEFAIEFSKIHINDVIFKLHPSEYKDWQEHYPMLVDSRVIVIDDSVPLYTLFTMCQAQVGVNSTALYEGIDFGLKTFLADIPGVEYFDRLIKERVVYKVKSPEELDRMIDVFVPSRFDNEFFFKRNSVENITDVIQRIVKEETK